mmetsp:Transcript_13619/g.40587  ORF Transcript_13619/g.40587 Transcript_13619/m.40587 type:complete len:222 (+) Transcript_13619:1213-1878(+)
MQRLIMSLAMTLSLVSMPTMMTLKMTIRADPSFHERLLPSLWIQFSPTCASAARTLCSACFLSSFNDTSSSACVWLRTSAYFCLRPGLPVLSAACILPSAFSSRSDAMLSAMWLAGFMLSSRAIAALCWSTIAWALWCRPSTSVPKWAPWCAEDPAWCMASPSSSLGTFCCRSDRTWSSFESIFGSIFGSACFGCPPAVAGSWARISSILTSTCFRLDLMA